MRAFVWYKGHATVQLCVGSVVVTAISWAALDRMKHELTEMWAVAKLGGAKVALGMVIDGGCHTIAVTINHCASRGSHVLKEFRMADSKPPVATQASLRELSNE